MKYTFILLLPFVMISCQRNINLRITETTETATVVKGNCFEGVIFSETMALDTVEEKRFTPTVEEVELAESILQKQWKTSIKRKFKDEYELYRYLNQFHRQYVGIINGENEKSILIFLISKNVIQSFPIQYQELSSQIVRNKVNIKDNGTKYCRDFANFKINFKSKELYDLEFPPCLSWNLF
jgi:hypothetical protein